MILEIKLNDAETVTRTLTEAIEHLTHCLDTMEFYPPKTAASTLVTRMYGECATLTLTAGGDTLKIRKLDG